MSSVEALEDCPVYACVLRAGDHEPVDRRNFECEPGSFWHFDGEDGHWISALEEEPPEEIPAQSLYPPLELQRQAEIRAMDLQFAKDYWQLSVEDVTFEHLSLNSSVPFSGDHRPTRTES